jgi:tetratricopeptide (TPR) repeat protein/tRNA A-37 threonylcarbamoyl transferase component Bud32
VERIGPYAVRELIAKGGAGAVYRCVDPATGREVAVKVLRQLDQASAYQRERFRREVAAMAELRHPHVVAVLGAGEHSGSPWLALELVRGMSLQERLDRRGPLPERAAAEVVLKLAQAMAQAHAGGVLHRDLKPDNVLLDERGEPRLTDFGLARDLDGGQDRLTKTGAVVGTPGYMPPEQASGGRSQIGPHTDVYGLGAILYACLTGESPVKGSTLAEILVATVDQAPTPPSKGNPGVSDALERICLRCLDKDPGARYVTAGALSMALEGFLTGPLASSQSASARAPLVVVSVAGLIGLAALGGWWLVSGPVAPAEPEPLSGERRSAELPGGPGPAPAQGANADPAETPPSSPQEGPADAGDTPADRAQAERRLAVATSMFEAGDFEGAVSELDEVIRLDPTYVLALAQRGEAKRAAGDPQAALEDLDQAVRLNPDHVPARLNRAAAKADLGDHQGTIEDLDHAIRVSPRWVPSWTKRGVAKAHLGDYLGAIRDHTAALELSPTRASSWVGRGYARLSLGDEQGAIEDLDRAIEIDPTLAAAWFNLGAAKLNLRRYQEAIEDLSQAIRFDPGFAQAWFRRGLGRDELGQFAEAIADLDRSIELDGSYAPAWVQRGRSKLNAGDDRGGLVDLDQAISLDQTLVSAWSSRGSAKFNLGDFRGAVEDLDVALGRDPGDVSSWLTRGSAKANLEDHQGALADLDQAVQLDSSQGLAWAQRGGVKLTLGDEQGALVDLNRALELDPEAYWAGQIRGMRDSIR